MCQSPFANCIFKQSLCLACAPFGNLLEYFGALPSLLPEMASSRRSTHMPSVLRYWFRAALPWRTFPYALAGYNNMRDFILNCAAATLIPEICLRDETMIGSTRIKADDEIESMQQVRYKGTRTL
jgi:hypothetical protein